MSNSRKNQNGRFKRNVIKGIPEKMEWAKDYYKKHKKEVDRAANKYRERNDVRPGATNEQIFVNEMIYGKDFRSKETAAKRARRKLVEMSGGDLDKYDAIHDGANRYEMGYSDLRKLNGKNKVSDYIEGNIIDGTKVELKASRGEDVILGYYKIKDPRTYQTVFIAKIHHYVDPDDRDEDYEDEHYEYMAIPKRG